MAELVKNIAFTAAVLAATAARAEVITKDEAVFFGYEIVLHAACGTRYATLDLAKFVNKGAKLKDLKALKTEIVHGKELAKAYLAEKGKRAFCHQPNSTPETKSDHASDARVLGSVAAKDELCGTHIYNAMIQGMSRERRALPRRAQGLRGRIRGG